MKGLSKFCSLIPLVLFVACAKQGPLHEDIARAEALIWSAPDSANMLLEQISYDDLLTSDKAYWELFHEFAQLKLNLPISPDSVMAQVVDYFSGIKPSKYLGEALYVQGAEYQWLTDWKAATNCLKQAEPLLLEHEDNALFLGMNYYKLGKCSEMEQLYHIAFHYYEQALPYFQSADHHYYLASCYRDIARTIPDRYNQLESMNAYYDSALYHAQAAQMPKIYYEIQFYKESWQPTIDSVALLQTCHILSDSFKIVYFDATLSHHYLEHGDLDKAEYYLQRFSTDTTRLYRHKFIHQYLQSCLLHAKHDDAAAYETLKNLYDRRNRLTELNGDANSVAIAKCYDVNFEKEKNLQLQMKKQRQFIILLSCILITLLVALIFYWGYKTFQRRYNAVNFFAYNLNKTAEKKELSLMKLFRKQLLAMSQLSYLVQRHTKDAPNWLKKYISENSLQEEANQLHFLNIFEELYGDFISNLHRQYPALQTIDLFCIALFLIGLKPQNVAELMNYHSQTIWNRRKTIKARIGTESDLDEWIFTQYNNYYSKKHATGLL